jgi:hypothetical protein
MLRLAAVGTRDRVDGFFEGPRKEIDWRMVDDELHAFSGTSDSGPSFGERLRGSGGE